MNELQARLLTAYLFADMLNDENRGQNFKWSRFTDQAIAYVAEQFYMAEKELTPSTRYAIADTANELIERAGLHD